MCKLFVALMVAIIFSIVAAERIAKQSKKPCYSSGSQRNPLRKLLIGMRNGLERRVVMKQHDYSIGLRETLLGKLVEKKGADYINSVEFGAAKCILLSFAEWITSSYPLMDISHITKAMVMEYLITIVRKARESGQPREYGFARLTAKILSVVTGIDIDVDTETTLMQQYSMYCPSCGILAKFVSDKVFYGRDFGGHVYYCPKCNSRVGAYEGTPIPMGTMADQETLRLRKKCHEVFDRKWQNGQMTRDEAYVWLADVMKLQPYEAHIGKFGKRQCSKLLMLLGVSEKEQECVKKQSAVVSKAAAFA
mgnify:CR=1 FL=1